MIYKPPILIYKPPIMFYKPPILIYKPPIMFYKPPIMVYKTPFPVYKNTHSQSYRELLARVLFVYHPLLNFSPTNTFLQLPLSLVIRPTRAAH
jgi:hypothetical protein